MKKFLFMPAVALTLLFGCAPTNEFKAPPPPGVTVQNPEQKTVTIYQTFPGRVVAHEEADIRARVKGFLKTIDFKDGQRVEAGDLLFTLEPEQYVATVKSAEAQLAQAHAALKLADATLKRNQDAFKSKAVSEVDVLTAEANSDSAQAQVMFAEAALQNAKLDLSYTKIYAPFAGRVARRSLSVGNLVGSGEATLLTTVVAEQPIDVFFNVDERALMPYRRRDIGTKDDGKMLPPVKLELADGGEHSETGIVDYSDPEIDPDTGTLRVRAVYQNEGIYLLPGMYGKILLPQVVENAILVPDFAVQQDMAGHFVLTVNADNVIESIYVSKGDLVGTQRIVTKDPTRDRELTISDRIVVNGLQRARPGIVVTASEASAAPAAAPSN